MTVPDNGGEYNGWPNRETWVASVRLDNDYQLYQERLKVVAASLERRQLERSDDYGHPHAVGWVARDLEEWFKRRFVVEPEFRNSHVIIDQRRDEFEMVREIGSLWRVDWRAIAENYVAEALEGAAL
tara:strand:+ start:475 stop:855 length:381 start_codon:yes stop_codon:yes gene_type:complete